MTATAAAHAAAMLAAHELCGRLIDQLPDETRVSAWEIMIGYVGGSYDRVDSDLGARAGLARLATLFGLTYSETNGNGLMKVEAAGEIDGIPVQLWAHITLAGTDL